MRLFNRVQPARRRSLGSTSPTRSYHPNISVLWLTKRRIYLAQFGLIGSGCSTQPLAGVKRGSVALSVASNGAFASDAHAKQTRSDGAGTAVWGNSINASATGRVEWFKLLGPCASHTHGTQQTGSARMRRLLSLSPICADHSMISDGCNSALFVSIEATTRLYRLIIHYGHYHALMGRRNTGLSSPRVGMAASRAS